jgi:hypothetical protein
LKLRLELISVHSDALFVVELLALPLSSSHILWTLLELAFPFNLHPSPHWASLQKRNYPGCGQLWSLCIKPRVAYLLFTGVSFQPWLVLRHTYVSIPA